MRVAGRTWDRKTAQTVLMVVLAVAFAVFWVSTGGEDGRTPSGTATPPAPASDTTPTIDPSEASSGGAVAVLTGDRDPATGLPWVLEEDLPILARNTLALIDQGGPHPYDRDGVTFENREGILPDHARGYYREYTVVAPGADNRGPLRIVTGASDEFFWTEDHYESFERISRSDK